MKKERKEKWSRTLNKGQSTTGIRDKIKIQIQGRKDVNMVPRGNETLCRTLWVTRCTRRQIHAARLANPYLVCGRHSYGKITDEPGLARRSRS